MSYTVGKSVNWDKHFGKPLALFTKLKICIFYDPAILLLTICPRKVLHMYIRRNEKNGHDSIICDNPKLQITQKSINRRMET